MIRIDNARKQFGDLVAVNDVTTTIPAHGVTSIIGPNGGGKSTLLSLISRLAPMDGGRIEVGGLDVTTTPSRQLATTMAILRQENHLTMRLSVRDLVAFGRFPHSQGRLTSIDREHIDKAMAQLDLTSMANKFVDELSGGQRQRAFIAMVLAQDTTYLLLDEPLNNLDMKHSVETMKLIRRLADEFGKTVVVVVHDINFASCYSDRILALRDGNLICEGTPDDIMSTDVLRTIYDIDIRIEKIDGKRIGVYFT
ncbi:iron ABC transporter ATP-binding protein [Jonesia denitrificans]|uniref:ABC transporter related n=1 Tax=Jonesia denitrificans (strain ATCC 14870 / DSM 20603 / BCRC 15368 / CIP 55.134 / JCM 11481 / NBRC 15587 / NCTC 10816 / Prevot 55134) TaxID=471856 RepID=C7R2L2_JONDD|nr:ATP-binding cassette domain-containing protein [Jonesia denitrificans]ACV10003.1 ABC transporter related [Jonesia denitrificans DSM 20603]ASE08763.1 iron ABC transporter ATP-binding protein [Jonesia denitrificans]QXB43367.1 ATP-binding cassette domain-containing protein [Jonesia denitrificans]SQH22783.1 Iron(3+)-hydroxamate import ATP-binding protein FhuC [Jonesia denitrificans]